MPARPLAAVRPADAVRRKDGSLALQKYISINNGNLSHRSREYSYCTPPLFLFYTSAEQKQE
jgi:hypothetical protein